MSNTVLSKPLSRLSRRAALGMPAALAFAGSAIASERKRIATVITEYRLNSHADCYVTWLLEGYYHNGRLRRPDVQVVSMYTDQVPENDMSRYMAEKHRIKIFKTVREALTLGGSELDVDGVVFIGEHGNYAWNIKGQKLYPRYFLFRQIVDVFRKSGRSVPVFFDKHFSYDWDEAKWIYDQARELDIPMIAGSCLPLTWRRPPLELELESPVEKAVVSWYGGKESYGFHGLETLQCMVERRDGGETGISAVQCLEGPEVWKWTDANPWAKRLLDESLSRCTEQTPGSPRDNVKMPIVFVLDYRSGLKAAVYLLSGHVKSASFAADLRGKDKPVSTEMWCQWVRPWGHGHKFAYYIDDLLVTGKPSYPVERTLLTTGAIAALMDSSFKKGRMLETPHLNITYRAQKESLFDRGPVPPPESKTG
jgi:hypothetical protein